MINPINLQNPLTPCFKGNSGNNFDSVTNNWSKIPVSEELNMWKTLIEFSQDTFFNFYVFCKDEKMFNKFVQYAQKKLDIKGEPIKFVVDPTERNNLKQLNNNKEKIISARGDKVLVVADNFESFIKNKTESMDYRTAHDYDQEIKEDEYINNHPVNNLKNEFNKAGKKKIIIITHIGNTQNDYVYNRSAKAVAASQFKDGVIEL